MMAVPVPSCEYFLRVDLALELCLKEAVLGIFHNDHKDVNNNGLPRDPGLLYTRMVQFRNRHSRHLNRVIYSNQWALLCPANGQTDSSSLDITLDVVVIENESGIQPSGGNWRVQQILNPQNDADYCIIARDLRNRVKHGTLQSISTVPQFTSYWTEIENALKGLHYNNMPLFHQLKTGPIEPYTKASITALEQKLADLEKKQVDVNTKEIAELNQKHIELEENKVDVNETNICSLKICIASNEDKIEQLKSDMKSISLCLQYLRGKYSYVLREQYNINENVFVQKTYTHYFQRKVRQFLCSLEVLFWFFFRIGAKS